MKATVVLCLILGVVLLVIAVFAAAIVLFVPQAPPVMEAVAQPFRKMDFKSLPPVSYYQARDGARLAYRSYPAVKAKQRVVLIHGSSAGGSSMHALAAYCQQREMDVYVPDMRGHGESGHKGDIAYIGQLEDDLEDFVNQLFKGEKNPTLVGFSAGGGFVLRFAASSRQKLFDRYIALAPFIRYDAPTTRPNNGEWARASVPRILAITLSGPAGRKWLGHLPVIAFGIDPETAKYRTATYSYRLWSNFALHYNYPEDLKAIKQPLTVMVGENDELFYPQKFLSVFARTQPHADIQIVPSVGHITLISEPIGMAAVADVLLQ